MNNITCTLGPVVQPIWDTGHDRTPIMSSMPNESSLPHKFKGSQNIRAKDARKGGKRKEERKRRQLFNTEIFIRFFEGCWHLLRER